MKKTLFVLVIAAVAGIGSYLVSGAEHMGGGMMGGGMMQGGGGMMNSEGNAQQGMGQGGMMGGGMMDPMGMGSMMGGGMLAASEDGGVFVLMGNQLFKYDKDLNLVKQVEIKVDWEAMQKMMMERHNMMMQNRNMMMQRRGMMMGGQSESK